MTELLVPHRTLSLPKGTDAGLTRFTAEKPYQYQPLR